MTSKPNETDSQTNIYIEVVNRIYGKTKSMLDWPLYTPSPNRESSNTFSVGGGGIKWPVQHRFCFFRGFTWTGHFIPPLQTENTGWIYVYLWRQSPKIILKIYGHLWTKTTATCPSSTKWFARKFSSIKWLDHVISGSPTLCINWPVHAHPL